MKLSQLVSALDVRLENGSPDSEITGVAGIEEAGPGQVTFVANPKYAAVAKTTNASAVIVDESFPGIATATLRSKNAYLAFARAIELFYQPPQYAPGVHSTAVVHPSARIGAKAHVGPYVVIDRGVQIGNNASPSGSCGHLSRAQRLEITFLPMRIPWCANIANWEITSSCKMVWSWAQMDLDLLKMMPDTGTRLSSRGQRLLGTM